MAVLSAATDGDVTEKTLKTASQNHQ